MNNEIKHILIDLAKLHDYETYDLKNERLEFINYFNKIKLQSIDKNIFSVSYNLDHGQHEVSCKTESIYDTLEILMNRENHEIIS